MPIFEFICEGCQKPFEELLRSATVIDQVICPECGSEQVHKRISTFATKSSGGQSYSSFAPTSSCNTGST